MNRAKHLCMVLDCDSLTFKNIRANWYVLFLHMLKESHSVLFFYASWYNFWSRILFSYFSVCLVCSTGQQKKLIEKDYFHQMFTILGPRKHILKNMNFFKYFAYLSSEKLFWASIMLFCLSNLSIRVLIWILLGQTAMFFLKKCRIANSKNSGLLQHFTWAYFRTTINLLTDCSILPIQKSGLLFNWAILRITKPSQSATWKNIFTVGANAVLHCRTVISPYIS